jgi:hypothetical protein
MICGDSKAIAKTITLLLIFFFHIVLFKLADKLLFDNATKIAVGITKSKPVNLDFNRLGTDYFMDAICHRNLRAKETICPNRHKIGAGYWQSINQRIRYHRLDNNDVQVICIKTFRRNHDIRHQIMAGGRQQRLARIACFWIWLQVAVRISAVVTDTKTDTKGVKKGIVGLWRFMLNSQ